MKLSLLTLLSIIYFCLNITIVCAQIEEVGTEPEDPCASLACGYNAECVHDLEGTHCKCKKGYDGDGFTCIDIDECASNPCDPHATCKNLDGSFVCTCEEGYEGDGLMCSVGKRGVFKAIVDDEQYYDEAEGETGRAQEGLFLELRGGEKITINQLEARGYVDPGWVVKHRGGGLVEAEVFYDLPAEMTAGNVGNYVLEYKAVDKSGNEVSRQRTVTVVDINECELGLHDCSVHAECINTVNSYECECKAGFEGNGKKCSDVDECRLGTHNCHPKANCSNTPGSFKCTCMEGYEGNGVECTDIDECKRGTHRCDEQATCINTDGGYECVCNDGFEGNGFVCTPLNSCEHGTHDCHPEWATCTKTDLEPAGYRCECKRGFKGDGRTCVDIDECADPNLYTCPEHSHCSNTVGSYECICDNGFEKGEDDYSCVDIDECARETDKCDSHANCTNTMGSYYCTCKDGYLGDGFSCQHVEGSTDIALRGDNPKNISQCDAYLEEGFVLSDVHRNKLRVSVSLPPALMEDPVQKPGTYVIQYNVRDDRDHHSIVTRTVNVAPLNPCILPEGHRCRHKCHDFAKCVFLDPGYRCDCREGFENTVGEDGELLCKDVVPPVIMLKGEEEVTLRACRVCKWYDPGENYDEARHGGYYAYDELPDGRRLDITDRVVITNESIGNNEWKIMYNVEDLAGNLAATRVRIVKKEVEDILVRIENVETFLNRRFAEFEPYPKAIDRFTLIFSLFIRALGFFLAVLLLVYFVPRLITLFKVMSSPSPPPFEEFSSAYDLYYSMFRPWWTRSYRQRMIQVEFQRRYRDDVPSAGQK